MPLFPDRLPTFAVALPTSAGQESPRASECNPPSTSTSSVSAVGNWLYLTPGIGALIGRESTCKAEVKLPLYRSLANTQLDSSAIFQVGISRSF
jgi:hypothetical protein